MLFSYAPLPLGERSREVTFALGGGGEAGDSLRLSPSPNLSPEGGRTKASGRGSWIGSTPFWKQLLKKMGPREGAMTQRTPMPIIAHTAPSRLEPQAKLLSATTISAPR